MKDLDLWPLVYTTFVISTFSLLLLLTWTEHKERMYKLQHKDCLIEKVKK